MRTYLQINFEGLQTKKAVVFDNLKRFTFVDKKDGVYIKSRIYYYARVSSKEQNLDRQLAAFQAMGATERDIITDRESGKSLNRPGYQALKSTILRSGDTLVVKSLDRLSRSKADIKNELEYFKANGIRLKVIDLPTTMMDLPDEQAWVFEMVNNILIEVLGSIAEQERVTIWQRQSEGIAVAKVNGKHLGRPVIAFPPNWIEVYQMWKSGKITAKRAMEMPQMKRSSFYKLAHIEEQQSAAQRLL